MSISSVEMVPIVTFFFRAYAAQGGLCFGAVQIEADADGPCGCSDQAVADVHESLQSFEGESIRC